MSLKMVPFERLGMLSNSPSIIIIKPYLSMAVSFATLEIFSVREWPDLEFWACGCSRSFERVWGVIT